MLKKKNYSVKGKNVLGGKDQKEIRERCIGLYHLRDNSDDATTVTDGSELTDSSSGSSGNSDLIQQAFFPKKARVMQIRWQYTSSPHCYALITTVNDVPYCVELFSLPDLDASSFGGTAIRKPIVSAFFPTVFGYLRLRQLTAAHVVGAAAPALKMACQSFLFGNGRSKLVEGGEEEEQLSPGDQVDLAWSHRIASAVVWCHGATSAHVVRGAHLMVPGICSVTVVRQEVGCDVPLPGSLVFVCTNNNPVPFAVGLMSHELHAALRKQPISGCGLNWFLVDRARGHGPGVLVLHSIGDFLWEEWWPVYHSTCTKEKVSPQTAVVPTTHASVALGNSTEVDEGAMPDLLKGLLMAAAAAAAEAAPPKNAAEDDVNVSRDADLSAGTAVADPSAEQSPEPSSTAAAEGDHQEPQETNQAEEDVAQEEQDDEEEAEEDWWLLFPTVESLLTFAACETVKALKPSKFPVPCTSVISQLNKLYPRGLPTIAETGSSVDAQRLELVKGPIDWKKTPFKKALAFLTSVVAKDGTMSLKETSPGVHAVTAVNKMSDLMRNHRRVFTKFLQLIHRPQFDAELDAEQQQQSEVAATSGSSSSSSLQVLQSVEVVYRPQSGLHPQLFQLLCRGRWVTTEGVTVGGKEEDEGDDDEEDDLFDGLVRDRKTMRDRVRAYLKAEGLMVLPSAPGMLPHATINPLLRNLWPANCNTVPETIPLNELDETVVRKFCPMHVLTYGDGRRRLHNGPPPTVKIHVERRCGNKHVTLVRNLGPFGFRLEQLAGEWRHALATSVNITEATVGVKTKNLGAAGAPSAAKRGDLNKEIQVLGSLASRVEQLLVDKFGVPRSLIVVTSK